MSIGPLDALEVYATGEEPPGDDDIQDSILNETEDELNVTSSAVSNACSICHVDIHAGMCIFSHLAMIYIMNIFCY